MLAIGVIFYVLPWMGLELLDTARAVAEFDLPMRVLGLWWGSPRGHSPRSQAAAPLVERELLCFERWIERKIKEFLYQLLLELLILL